MGLHSRGNGLTEAKFKLPRLTGCFRTELITEIVSLVVTKGSNSWRLAAMGVTNDLLLSQALVHIRLVNAEVVPAGSVQPSI